MEWSAEVKINNIVAEYFKKMILQMKIAQEMKEYEEQLLWEQYGQSKTIKDMEMSLLNN